MNTRKARIELVKIDAQWLSGWLEALLRDIPLDNLTPDVLRMRSILRQLDKALLKLEDKKK